jgi:hypothetical protein
MQMGFRALAAFFSFFALAACCIVLTLQQSSFTQRRIIGIEHGFSVTAFADAKASGRTRAGADISDCSFRGSVSPQDCGRGLHVVADRPAPVKLIPAPHLPFGG